MQQVGNKSFLYHHFNELLLKGQSDNELLLSQIRHLQQIQLQRQNIRQRAGETVMMMAQDKIIQDDNGNSILQLVNVLTYGLIDASPTLGKTQSLVIKQIGSLMVQTVNIEKQLQIQNKLLAGLTAKLQNIKAGKYISPNLNQSSNKPNSILLKQREIATITRQIEDSMKRVEMINLMDDQIDEKIEKLKARNIQLHEIKEHITNRSFQRSSLLNQKINLQRQIKQLLQIQQNDLQLQNWDSLYDANQIAEEVCESLRNRLSLQQQVITEEQEKQQFAQILFDFTHKYEQVKAKNRDLKVQLKGNGDLPI